MLTLPSGEWGNQAVLPPMGELQATLIDEIRYYLQHLENAIITLHRVRQRNGGGAIVPLLQAPHDAITSSNLRIPSSPRIDGVDSAGTFHNNE